MEYTHLPHIAELSVHYAGNPYLEEKLVCAEAPAPLNDELRETLVKYFRLEKQVDEYFQFDHESNLDMNPVYAAVEAIFNDPEMLHKKSVEMAEHLFKSSNHPNIKGGELFVAYLENCTVEGEVTNAVGIFKAEQKFPFLEVLQNGQQFSLDHHVGIDPGKLDKGCIVYNLEGDDGYVVAVVDHTNKNAEARYWTDDFLGLRVRSDAYHHTEQAVAMCQDYIRKEMPQHYEVSKPDQADMLNRSAKFFKEQERFDLNEFSNTVMGAPDVIDDFSRYKHEYEQERGAPVADGFDISPAAVKKQSKGFKSVLKLDKNFHIYIHGNREMIERGTDEFGRKFYKIYFEEEK